MRTCLILSFLILNFIAFADDKALPRPVPSPVHLGMKIEGDALGRRYVAYVLPSDMTNTPAWSAAMDGEPPVSVQTAIKSAKAALAGNVADLPFWSVSGIELKSWLDRWFYEITFAGPSRSKMTVIVLMDGRTICPARQEADDGKMTGQASMEICGEVDGQEYCTNIRGADVVATPVWNTDGEKPPLSTGAAVTAASNALAKALANPAVWKPESVRLEEFPSSGHWIYRVVFNGPTHRVPNVPGNFGTSLTVVVLMNGDTYVPKPKGAK